MKIIIVEDERIIRNGLVKHISWNSLGIGEVKAAANAEEALEICENYVPDIVISDISMPGENGIELCRKLKKHFPEIEIIFVTAYADKEYLKAAIDMHAVRYVEKPINGDDISEAVREAVRQHRKTIEHKAAHLHTLFIDSASIPIYTAGKNVFQVGILHFDKQDRLVEWKRKLTEELGFWLRKNSLSMLVEISDSTTLSFLLSGKDESFLAQSTKMEFIQVIQKIMGEEVKWFLAVGSQVVGTEKIQDSWQSALYAMRALAYMGWNHIIFREDLQGSHKYTIDRRVIDRLTEEIYAKSEEAALKVIDDMTEEMQKNQVFLNGDVRYIYYSMHSVLDRAGQAMRLNDKKNASDSADSDLVEKAETFVELGQHLKNRVLVLFQEDETQKSSYVTKMVMDYIWENYQDSALSIKVLAEHVCLTPTYLSNMFKKNAGITIGQYIVDVRIEKAKRLMKDPQLKFYQVADMVGYEDANYFAKIFKKKTGITPSEYKESLSIR